MAFSEWKTSKTPKHGGGISIATIAIAEEQAAAQQTVQEPVKTGGEVLPDYRHLVKCQQCQHLNQDAACTTLNIMPLVDALRACDAYIAITLRANKHKDYQNRGAFTALCTTNAMALSLLPDLLCTRSALLPQKLPFRQCLRGYVIRN